jgi:hypothetical protein
MYAEYFLIFSSQYPIFTHNSNERPKKVHTQLSTKTIKVTENRSNQDHLTRRGLQKGYGQASTTRRGQKETSNLNSITFVAQIFLNRKEKKKVFPFIESALETQQNFYFSHDLQTNHLSNWSYPGPSLLSKQQLFNWLKVMLDTPLQ